MAKCETRQSLLNFRSISAEADGIIVSRGNLGLDVVSGEGGLSSLVGIWEGGYPDL